jgi:hypothetical protein
MMFGTGAFYLNAASSVGVGVGRIEDETSEVKVYQVVGDTSATVDKRSHRRGEIKKGQLSRRNRSCFGEIMSDSTLSHLNNGVRDHDVVVQVRGRAQMQANRRAALSVNPDTHVIC